MIINTLQSRQSSFLPKYLQTWDFLPEYLRSLKPYDKLIKKYLCFCKICQKIILTNKKNNLNNENDAPKIVVFSNEAYVSEKL